ncbi:MAG TPA: class I SAM-dependent methyltransferase [Candidatus Angelobacter sp.]|jgi:SAM-dependent methyltransferase
MSQEDLWEHFQNKGVEAFSLAGGRLSSLLSYAESQRHERGVLLNIGCGNGYLELTAKQRGWVSISVDPDPRAVERLRSQGVEAHCGMIEALPLDSNSADVVICSEVLEHLSQEVMEDGLKEIQRVLRPKGVLIGTTPYRENLKDLEIFCPHCKTIFHRWGHQQSFDEVSMRQAISRYLEVKRIGPRFFPVWQTNWKGKALNAALLALSCVGAHGKSSNLFFAAVKQ